MHAARPTLSPKEALNEVYRLTPQIRDTDDLLAPSKTKWAPFTLFFQPSNYKSASINTDDLGFRISVAEGKSLKVSDYFEAEAPVNLVVGTSTVMGTGATSDSHTIASYLSQARHETWLNFGARAYNSTQEIILFLLHQHRFKNIKNVVVVSGMNNLALEGLPVEFRSEHGPYYFSYEFNHFMNLFNIEQARKEKAFLQRVLTRSERNSIAPSFTSKEIAHSDRVERAADATTRVLAQWKALLAPYNATLTFMLQPLSTWTKDTLTQEEAQLDHAVYHCPNNFWVLFGSSLTKDVYRKYTDHLERKCKSLEIPFFDLNALIHDSKFVNESLFVDPLHFNDRGYEVISTLISSVVDSNR